MQLHRPPGDREAQAYAAARPVTIGIHAVERIKNPQDRLLGTPGP